MSITITRSDLCETLTFSWYKMSFFGFLFKTQVCHIPADVDSWLSYVGGLSGDEILTFGLDVKYLDQNNQNRPAVLQLCVGHNCLIFQLLFAEEIPQSLRDFFDNQYCVFIGSGIKRHAEILSKEYGLEVRNLVDVRDLAMGSTELESIVREVLGIEIEKPENVSLSNWADESLSLDQVKYASIDVIVLLEIKYNRFRKLVDLSSKNNRFRKLVDISSP